MKTTIRITGVEELNRYAMDVAKKNTTAVRNAINDSLRWGRTRIREDIGKEYNVKLSRLYDRHKSKGLNVKAAKSDNLTGEITAGHDPVSLHHFNGVRQSSEVSGYQISFASNIRTRKQRTLRKAIRKPAGLSVSIRKGQSKLIRSSFRIPKFGQRVFAKGAYSKTTFAFRHTRINKAGQDTPISVLNAPSVATMALNRNVWRKYNGPIQQKYSQELQRQLKISGVI